MSTAWPCHPKLTGVFSTKPIRVFPHHSLSQAARSYKYGNSFQSKPRCILCSASAGSLEYPALLPLSSQNEDFDKLHGYPLLAQRTSSSNGSQPMRLAHWLIPQRVLLGRYPFLHHSYNNRKHAEGQIEALLQSGVTTFVCLQAELPPQEKMKAGGSGGFIPYRAVATMLHSSMHEKPDVDVKASIRNKHLDQFLPQKRKAGTNSSSSGHKKELEFLHFPIQDLSIPSQDKVRGFVTDLMKRLEDGQILYMHCWGGRGRAGTIGACLLKAVYGIDGDEALDRLQRSFSTRGELYEDGTSRLSPETEQQRQFVRDFQPS